MKLRLLTIPALIFLGGFSFVSAQSYDDDDIYFNPDKAKKAVPVKKKTTRTQPNAIIYYPVADYPAADTYTPVQSSSTRDIDEYNRRGIFAPDSIPFDSIGNVDFLWTRQIEKFHNPDVVTASSDPDVAQYYYAQPANVSIVVNTPGYWGNPYFDSYYYGYPYSWVWRNYWNNYWWGPSLGWSVGWGWDPYWNWGWGPSWSWGPSWGWGPGWGGWYPPSRPPRPGIGNVRPPYNDRHHGYVGNVRPGYSTGNSRPGYGNGSVGNTRPSNSGQRPGRYNNNNSNYRPSRNTNSNQNSFSTPSYNNGGFRGGNSGSFGGGGGYRGGGGGGSRGGRH